MTNKLTKVFSKRGLDEVARRTRRAAEVLAEGAPQTAPPGGTYVAIRRENREIRVTEGFACSASLPALVENFDYVHSSVQTQFIAGVAVADFSRRQLHHLTQSGANVELSFEHDYLAVRKDNREIRLNPSHIVYVWDVGNKLFDHDHSAVVPEMQDGVAVADYSQPRVHRMTRTGLEFAFPSFAESDDSGEAYLAVLQLKPGDVVLDFGAYAGVSGYFLSHAVGPEGLVGCFEPDETNFRYLEDNIARHGLSNVRAFSKGLWTETTKLSFQSEGNMGSSLVSVIGRKTNAKLVDVVSLDDAAALLGRGRVAGVKMDIEGAELEVIRHAGEFLRRHQARLVIEPHPVAGTMNTDEICHILRSFGYTADVIAQGLTDWPLIAARPQ